MAEKSISLRLKVDSKSGQASIKKTTTGLKKLGKVGAKAADKLSKGFVAAAAKMKLLAIGIAASTAAIGYMAKKTLDSADATAKLADSLGYSIKLMQEYAYAAGLSGVSQGTLNSSMLAFAKRLGEAKAGTGALVTYLKKTDKALLAQLTSTSDVNKALEIFMNALGNVKSSTDRAALASAAFSRAGIAMTVMVKDGGAGLRAMQKEAHALGLVLGDELFRNAEKLNDSMSKVSQVIKILFTKAVLMLAPYIDSIVTAMVGWIARNQELIDRKFHESIDKIKNAIKFLTDNIDLLIIALKILGGLTIVMAGSAIISGVTKLGKAVKWLAGGIGATAVGIGGVIAYFKLLNKESLQYIKGWRKIPEAIVQVIAKLTKYNPVVVNFLHETQRMAAAIPGWGKILAGTIGLGTAAWIAYTSHINKAIEAQGKLLKKTKEWYKESKIPEDELKTIRAGIKPHEETVKIKETPTFDEELKAMELRATKMREMAQIEQEVLKESRDMAEENRVFEREIEEQKRIAAKETVDYKLTLMQDYYKRIEAEAQEAFALEEEIEDESLRMARETAEYQNKLADEKYGYMKNAMQGWANSFSGTLNDMLWGANITFKEIATSFAKMVTQMMIQKYLIENLFGGGGKGIGGLLSGALSFAGGLFGAGAAGAAAPPVSTGAYYIAAKGGAFLNGISGYSNQVVNRPTQFAFAKGSGLMGEAGPEAIMPLTRTSGGDLGVKTEGGGDTTIIIHAIDSRSFAEVVERNPGSIVTVINDALQNRTGLLDTIRATV